MSPARTDHDLGSSGTTSVHWSGSRASCPESSWIDAVFAPRLTTIDYLKCPATQRMEGMGNEKCLCLTARWRCNRLLTPMPTSSASSAPIRRECLDFMIPLNERHLRRVLAEWVPHYNGGRPHASLGPGIPDRPSRVAPSSTGHRLPHGHRVAATPILAGLHHEYRLEPAAA